MSSCPTIWPTVGEEYKRWTYAFSMGINPKWSTKSNWTLCTNFIFLNIIIMSLFNSFYNFEKNKKRKSISLPPCLYLLLIWPKFMYFSFRLIPYKGNKLNTNLRNQLLIFICDFFQEWIFRKEAKIIFFFLCLASFISRQ